MIHGLTSTSRLISGCLRAFSLNTKALLLPESALCEKRCRLFVSNHSAKMDHKERGYSNAVPSDHENKCLASATGHMLAGCLPSLQGGNGRFDPYMLRG